MVIETHVYFRIANLKRMNDIIVIFNIIYT
jgi:hypothetical protein